MDESDSYMTGLLSLFLKEYPLYFHAPSYTKLHSLFTFLIPNSITTTSMLVLIVLNTTSNTSLGVSCCDNNFTFLENFIFIFEH